MLAEDKFAWLRDEEFARETLAGMNPYAIELVRVSLRATSVFFPSKMIKSCADMYNIG